MTLTKSSLLRQCFSKMDLTAGRGYLQCRMFSHTSIRPAKPLSQTFAMSKQPPQKSLRAQSMDMSRTELPQDLGLLPGTFIKPPLVQMPAWLFLPRERLRMEWIWLKTKVQNLWRWDSPINFPRTLLESLRRMVANVRGFGLQCSYLFEILQQRTSIAV